MERAATRHYGCAAGPSRRQPAAQSDKESSVQMPIVGPIMSTTVQLVYDSDSGGFGGPVDMDGPVVGRVSYQQDGADSLDLRIAVEFRQPHSVYQVFLTAGPAPASAHRYRDVGKLVTNRLG